MEVNRARRSILAVAAIAVCGLAFLHNPTEGYSGVDGGRAPSIFVATWRTERADCASSSLKEWSVIEERRYRAQAIFFNGAEPTMTPAQVQDAFRQYNELTSRCVRWKEEYGQQLPDRPISEWSSRAALVQWLSSPISLLWAVGCLGVAALVGIALAGSRRPTVPHAPNEHEI